MNEELARILNGYLADRRWSFEKLADATGLPRNTVYRWTKGEVNRVRHWQDLAKAARALGLNRLQVNALLEAGRHPAIGVLLERATDDEDQAVLARWAREMPNNIPHRLTSFVGREEELARITRLLTTERLVTLTGPGGTGKTRLAIESAHLVLDQFDTACFVDLSAVRDPNLVMLTISQALELKESLGESPFSIVVAHLRHRKALLVLDNFEQVTAAGPLVVSAQERLPTLKVLVTSRARLDVRGEQVVSVPPLDLPDPTAAIDDLSRNASVALFASRAELANPAFVLGQQNAQLVADVCVHLDGLPLGIELAAARTRHIDLRAMRERFPNRLGLASHGPRDVHDRQRNLRATIGWSYDLLNPDEQRLFRGIGVFAGGFTSATAMDVFGSEVQPAHRVEEALESLVDQSLLQAVHANGESPRYRMLETIREYALFMLDEFGAREAMQAAHAAYFTELAEQLGSEREGRARHSQALAKEADNIRSALTWCRDQGNMETGLRLSVALMPHWLLQDHQQEARTWLDAFMVAKEQVPPRLRARGELWQGLQLLRGTGDTEAASRHFDTALDLFHRHDDLVGLSEVKQAIGDVHRSREEWAQAHQRYLESRKLAEHAGNAHLVAHGYMGLAFCAQEEDRFDDAQQHWELTLEWTRHAGDQATEALALNSLGEMARYREEWPTAERYYRKTLHLATELDSDFRKALALHNLGYVALATKDAHVARHRFLASLELYATQEYRKGVAECLAGLGKVEASAGGPERAARLCGASEAILGELRTQLDTLDRADYRQTLELLKINLADTFESQLAEGRAMSFDQALAFANQPQSASGQG